MIVAPRLGFLRICEAIYMIKNTEVKLEDNTLLEKMIITKTRLKDRINEGLNYVRKYEKLNK